LDFCFVEHVLSPNGIYSGQKLKTLVSSKTHAITKTMKPNTPEMMSDIKSIAIITAIKIRIIRTAAPIFAFMMEIFIKIRRMSKD